MATSLREKFLEAMLELEARHGGSERAAAKAAGVSRQKWRAWKAGAEPRIGGVEKVLEAVEALAAR